MTALRKAEPVNSFTPFDLDPGPRRLPDWVIGAHIDWMEKWANVPRLLIKAAFDPLRFADTEAVWRKIDSEKWVAERDGCAIVHYHRGTISRVRLETDDDDTGPTGPLETTNEGGYCGRSFKIRMAPDSDIYPNEQITLHGPWHSLPLDGFVDVTLVVWDEDRQGYARRVKSPWHNIGGTFGLIVREQLLLDIMATFVPHIQFAEVFRNGLRSIEPLVADTGKPKGWRV